MSNLRDSWAIKRCHNLPSLVPTWVNISIGMQDWEGPLGRGVARTKMPESGRGAEHRVLGGMKRRVCALERLTAHRLLLP